MGGDSRDLEHNVLPVRFLPPQARTAHRLFSPSEPRRRGRVLRHACEGRGGAVGEEGHNDEGVQQAPDDGPVPLVALDRPPLVPVNGHAVAARRDAAAHRSRRSRPRQWRPGGRERKCDAAPPVLELVEEEARQRGLGRGAVGEEEREARPLLPRYQAAKHRLVHLVCRPVPARPRRQNTNLRRKFPQI